MSTNVSFGGMIAQSWPPRPSLTLWEDSRNVRPTATRRTSVQLPGISARCTAAIFGLHSAHGYHPFDKPRDAPMSERVLTVEDLRVALPVPAGTLHGVEGLSLHVDRGETLCIVGESGCGKTLTALAVMDLLPARALRTAARLELEGNDLARTSERAMADIRGNRMAMIF